MSDNARVQPTWDNPYGLDAGVLDSHDDHTNTSLSNSLAAALNQLQLSSQSNNASTFSNAHAMAQAHSDGNLLFNSAPMLGVPGTASITDPYAASMQQGMPQQTGGDELGWLDIVPTRRSPDHSRASSGSKLTSLLQSLQNNPASQVTDMGVGGSSSAVNSSDTVTVPADGSSSSNIAQQGNKSGPTKEQSGAASSSEKAPRSSASLYVKNLPPDTTELFLYQKFAVHGALSSCKVYTDPVTGKCRGVAFVNFVSRDAALKAMQQLQGTLVKEGHTMHISLQAPRSVRTAQKRQQQAQQQQMQAQQQLQLQAQFEQHQLQQQLRQAQQQSQLIMLPLSAQLQAPLQLQASTEQPLVQHLLAQQRDRQQLQLLQPDPTLQVQLQAPNTYLSYLDPFQRLV